MSKVDQFESSFRSAVKAVFSWEAPRLERVLAVTDLEAYPAESWVGRVRTFLAALDLPEQAWTIVTGDRFRTVRELLDLVEADRPDLICTYRHLHSAGWRWPFTLGEHLEVLTQATQTAVLVLPHPEVDDLPAHALQNTNSVMAMTDHLTGDDRLVSWAALLTEPGGTLFLTHVEDEGAFDRYLDAIGKIPDLDTDLARTEIAARLLKEPADYIESCRAGLEERRPGIRVEPVVVMGHHLAEYRRLVEVHEVDLLVINTKDQDQLAMHGLAYPLAVELRRVPLLML